MTPTYRIAYMLTNAGPGWRVYLSFGKARYMGERVYKSHQAAEQAAKRTGAVLEADHD